MDTYELNWHILWFPVGFGDSPAKLVHLLEAVKMDDSTREPELYYPVYSDRIKNKEILVPLFPGYAFLRCRWHFGLEDKIRELSGIYATFLKIVGTNNPHILTEEELENIKSARDARAELMKQWLHVEDFMIGDDVMVKSTRIVGQILYFIPPDRVMLKTKMFNNTTHPTPVKISDLEKI